MKGELFMFYRRIGVTKAIKNMLIEKKNISLPEMAITFYPDDAEVDQRIAEMKVIGIIRNLRQRHGLIITYDAKKRIYSFKGKRR
jgi:hypothetical protein